MQDRRFEFDIDAGQVDESKPLPYLWEIPDVERRLTVVRYVGKALGMSGRPKRHYRKNVERLLNGQPYRRGKPDKFRAIRRAMAEAVPLTPPNSMDLI